jgi:putative ABC transport system permease protein
MGVSIARRNLFEGRTKFVISVAGVALAMLLILALDAIWAGSMKQVTTYMNNSDFDVVIAQKGVRSMHMSTSAFPLVRIEEVRKVRGVDDVAPILYATDFFKFGENRNLAYVIGFDPKIGLGGPWEITEGKDKIEAGEIVIDEQIARRDGVKLGDKVEVLGGRFTVSGLTRRTTSITNSIAFVRFDDFERVRRFSGVTSYLLITVTRGSTAGEVARRISAKLKDVTVITNQEFAESERKAVRDMAVDIMRIMNFIGFLIGLAALALSIYTATLSKIKEYGVLKALGFKNRNLYSVVFEQTIISVVIGFGVAAAVSWAMSLTLAAMGSSILLIIEPFSLLKVVSGALVTGLLAAAIPIQRISGVKPAEVFRR